MVIDGGIVELSAVWQNKKYPDNKVPLVEKEAVLASHQTAHNCGVKLAIPREANICVNDSEKMQN